MKVRVLKEYVEKKIGDFSKYGDKSHYIDFNEDDYLEVMNLIDGRAEKGFRFVIDTYNKYGDKITLEVIEDALWSKFSKYDTESTGDYWFKWLWFAVQGSDTLEHAVDDCFKRMKSMAAVEYLPEIIFGYQVLGISGERYLSYIL